MSKSMKEYFENIENGVQLTYKAAEVARKKGFDPEEEVGIFIAKNLAERVEGLISVAAPQIRGSGMVRRITELEKQYGIQDWRVALTIALEITQQKFCEFKDEREAMEVGIRVGLAYITVGVVASPLEGFVELKLKDRKDGKKYFCLMYSGPIRSAGGTAASVSVIIADYIRKKMGYKEYDPTDDEVKRMITELLDYHEKVTNLQYLPSEEEIDFMVRNLPVQIDGDPSEKYEVSNYKDLERIETNNIRNGPCLVLGEGLTQKAKKLWKQLAVWGKDFDLKNWDFMEKFLKIQKKVKAKGEVKEEYAKIVPDYTYIKDLVAGRPVLTHPLRKGGFRLRYGRSRTSGFSSDALHPATMIVLDSFIGIGTQMRMERPGKATVVSSCDSLEGPIVKLNDGSVRLLETEEEAKKVVKDIEELLFLGDVLINHGDFLNRAHTLVPPGYCEEWWIQEVEKAMKEKRINKSMLGLSEELFEDPIRTKISAERAIDISKKLEVPLHPRYTYHWKDINKKQFLSLVNWLDGASIEKDKIIFPFVYDVKAHIEADDPKIVLELLGVPHIVVNKEYVVISKDDAKAFAASLGFFSQELNKDLIKNAVNMGNDVLDIVNSISEVRLRDKSGVFIGARMGRPEKAKMRKLTGSPHILFPVGVEGGRLRCFQAALEKGRVRAQFPIYFCEKCNKSTIYLICEVCGDRTKRRYYCFDCNLEMEERCNKTKMKKVNGKEEQEPHDCRLYKDQEIVINDYFKSALKILKLRNYPELIKGVRGTSNKDHIPEHLVKGILRAVHGIYVNKDGTTRYDMTEMAITHFKPKEIGVQVKELRKLGYVKDTYGNELKDENQILEIKPQDIILPACRESLEEGADDVLFKVAKFIDDLLVKLYDKKPFYNLKSKKDLVGELVVGLSPHTSAGIVGRIIGFSRTQGFLAHPLFHSIMRRDVDGDEACVILLMDAFLNFSRQYLPGHRGATQDEPLVLTSNLIPSEVDDMVFDMDIVRKYPLEFYEAAMEFKQPWDIKLDKLGDFLGTWRQYEGMGFTHDTDDLNNGVRCSAYKSLPTMREKVLGQMELAEKIRAVDESDVARLVIERHFMRDIKGNLRKFSMQQFRCVDCNEKHRRPPLAGKCTKCGGRLIFTIAEGSVIKYLESSISLAEKYDLPAYLKQTLMLTKNRIESVFGKDKEKQEGLGRWFG